MILTSKKEIFFFYNLPVFLFSLIPLFLITGPFLSDLSVSLISVLFLIYCSKRNNFSYFKNKYFYFFLIFWIYLVLNSLFNNFNFDSLKISFFYFRYGVFVIAVLTLMLLNDRILKYFFWCTFFCFIIIVVDGFYQYFVGETILGWKNKNIYRISSFFGNELILGSYLSKLWPIFFGLSILIFKRNDKLFFLLIIIFILSEALIFLTGERSSFFFINLSAIFVILFSKKLFKLRLITLFSSLILLILIAQFNPNAKVRMIDQTLDQINLAKNNDNQGSKKFYYFSKEHDHLYRTAYKIFLDNKIFGVGVKNFRLFCKLEKYGISQYHCSTHPHNFYIQILTETGITGFIFLIIILLYFFKKIKKHMIYKLKGKSLFSDFEICLLSGVLIYLWPFIPTGNVFNNWNNIILYLYFPFLLWAKNKRAYISN
jgi:O-antigen ligase